MSEGRRVGPGTGGAARTGAIGGRYELLGLLGGGGMGDVYLARDRRLGREVALKVLKERHAGSGDAVELFWTEARNAASLVHPNVVTVFDGGEDGGPYVTMEHVPGGTLAGRLGREGPLEPEEAVDIALRVAAALGEAHRRRLIHRDVRPHNVFLGPGGDVKVGNFRTARPAEAPALAVPGPMPATTSYVSPEQAKGGPVGPASDLYSLGVVLHEMLTGRVSSDAGSPATKRVTDPRRPAGEANPSVPGPLEAVITRLLAEDPAGRHGDAGELVRALERSTGRGCAGVSGRALPAKAAPRRRCEDGRSRPISRRVFGAILSASAACAGVLAPPRLSAGPQGPCGGTRRGPRSANPAPPAAETEAVSARPPRSGIAGPGVTHVPQPPAARVRPGGEAIRRPVGARTFEDRSGAAGAPSAAAATKQFRKGDA